MKLKVTKRIGLCIFFACHGGIFAMPPLKQLKTVCSGAHCLYKMTPAVHGPQNKVLLNNNTLKLGASLSTLALLCHIGVYTPPQQNKLKK